MPFRQSVANHVTVDIHRSEVRPADVHDHATSPTVSHESTGVPDSNQDVMGVKQAREGQNHDLLVTVKNTRKQGFVYHASHYTTRGKQDTRNLPE
jgi:hypothetical protein